MQCMTTEFSLTCPADTEGDKDFKAELSSPSIRCKPCGFISRVVDINPREGNCKATITWGPNVVAPGNRIDESMIDGYKVYLIDDCNRKGPSGLQVPKKTHDSDNCCHNDVYSVTFEGCPPADKDRFMIVPYQGDFELPHGVSTSALVDVTGGAVVRAALRMTVPDADKFREDPAVKGGLQEAVANSIPGVDKEQVNIIDILLVESRRLGAVERELAGGAVKVIFEVLVTEESTVTATDIGSRLETATDKLQSNVAASLTNYQVEVQEITSTVETIEPPTTTPPPTIRPTTPQTNLPTSAPTNAPTNPPTSAPTNLPVGPQTNPPTAGACPSTSFALIAAAFAAVLASSAHQIE